MMLESIHRAREKRNWRERARNYRRAAPARFARLRENTGGIAVGLFRRAESRREYVNDTSRPRASPKGGYRYRVRALTPQARAGRCWRACKLDQTHIRKRAPG